MRHSNGTTGIPIDNETAQAIVAATSHGWKVRVRKDGSFAVATVVTRFGEWIIDKPHELRQWAADGCPHPVTLLGKPGEEPPADVWTTDKPGLAGPTTTLPTIFPPAG